MKDTIWLICVAIGLTTLVFNYIILPLIIVIGEYIEFWLEVYREK
jgi:hypothetical protein